MCLSIIFASSDGYGIVFVVAGFVRWGRFCFENIVTLCLLWRAYESVRHDDLKILIF